MFLKACTSGNLVLAPAQCFASQFGAGLYGFQHIDKVQCLKDGYYLMPLEKSLSMCKFLTFKRLILEDTVWNPSGVQGTQGLFYGIPAVPVELASLMSCTGNPSQPSVLQPILKKHHSKALRLPVNRGLKFMMTGQLVNMDLLFSFIVCLC